MNAFELRVPPLIVTLLVAAIMWGMSKMGASIEIPSVVRYVVTATIGFVGGCIGLAGIVSFRRAKTTVNPLKPENASSLVTAGIYSVTRNPMYLGILFVLLAWAVFLTSAWALVGPVAFVLYINRFQIAPEERVMATMFGASYSEYMARVRRWL